MNRGRYFTLPTNKGLDSDRGDAYYRSQIAALYEKCLSHQSRRSSLYIGDLGTHCYLPYRIATSKSFALDLIPSKKPRDVNAADPEQMAKARWDILVGALAFAEGVRQQQRHSSHAQRVSLLEGELVGALVMKILISNAMLSLLDNLNIKESIASELRLDMDNCKDELLQFGTSNVISLPPSECEILYGRAGYLKAISLVRTELSEPQFGTDIARSLISQIWNEGRRFSASLNSPLPLMWEWHYSLYLGAAHGVTGVLHCLMDFKEELLQVEKDALRILDQTILQLNGYCFKSGNLSSSIPTSSREKKTDRLVQFCHGAPGHVLLLVQMHNKLIESGQNEHISKYLNQAKQITESVIVPRGLLRKGVGLCHGISGNGYCFLSVHGAQLKGTGKTDAENQSDECLCYAYMYANFALDHLDELEDVPDRPYSLYEGLSGLVCFLLDLVEQRNGTHSRFPCYEC